MRLSRPIPQPKPEPRKRTQGRKRRAEQTVKKSVRQQCVERDGSCRLTVIRAIPAGLVLLRRCGGVTDQWVCYRSPGFCDGRSEWAHLAGHRRSQTRGQAPERRHTTAHSLMLCRKHHAMEEAGKLTVIYLTDRGCDGPIQFRVG